MSSRAAFTSRICAQAGELTLLLMLSCCTPLLAQTNPPQLRLPSGIAYDATGNLYIADAQLNQVMEVALGGTVTVIAGTGAQGFFGDGDLAVAAQLNAPQAIAIAPDGTLYIADTANQRIRIVSNGIITTAGGTGVRGFNGDGNALQSELCKPSALAFDATGALIIADTCNHRIRRLSAGILTTVAGNGTQGFSGDNDLATQAQLDSPAGVAVAPNGNILIADTHNDRIRVIAASGIISTLAGTGTRGFSGDGAKALAAQLDRPHGLRVAADSSIFFADTDNQRLRLIDSNGIITTLAGVGIQGFSADGTSAPAASLNQPRSVALSASGSATLADSLDQTVQEIATDNAIYIVPGSASRTSLLSVTAPAATTYGNGTLTAVLNASAPDAQGTITLTENNIVIAQAELLTSTASLPVNTLNAGAHTLIANFPGDLLHPAASSSQTALQVLPAAAIAAANAATIIYGDFTPALSGTITGILPRDAASVTATFSTTARDLAAPGLYPIAATLTGTASSNYSLALAANSGDLQIVPAQSIVNIGSAQQTTYTGLPLTLTASLQSPTRGTPTGIINFNEGNTTVGTGVAHSGVVTATWLTPPVGTHSIIAVYAGDVNFLAGTSSAEIATVTAMPDFTFTATGNTSQTVVGGSAATYSLIVAAQGAPFSGSVSFSVAGLPTGASATFSPPATVPGAGSAPIALNIQTSPRAWLNISPTIFFGALGFLFYNRKRVRALRSGCLILLLTSCLAFITGCGSRSVSTQSGQTYNLNVTATSTNLAGAIVIHTLPLTLTIE